MYFCDWRDVADIGLELYGKTYFPTTVCTRTQVFAWGALQPERSICEFNQMLSALRSTTASSMLHLRINLEGAPSQSITPKLPDWSQDLENLALTSQ